MSTRAARLSETLSFVLVTVTGSPSPTAIVRTSESVEPGTVWTWNAIGKSRGAWNLSADADESRKGFLLNHLISDELPNAAEGGTAGRLANADPVTGQAAWYDLRVRIEKVAAEQGVSEPQFATLPLPPHMPKRPDVLRYGAEFRASAHGDAK